MFTNAFKPGDIVRAHEYQNGVSGPLKAAEVLSLTERVGNERTGALSPAIVLLFASGTTQTHFMADVARDNPDRLAHIELPEPPAPAGDLMTSDTARVEAALKYLQAYSDELDRIEMPPNGDDWNDTVNGLVAILRDGVVTEIELTTKHR